MNKKKILLFLLLPLLLPAGCTKEDNRNCPTGLYVSFEPNNPKHNYPELVAYVDLYFYNPDGNLMADFHYLRDDLRANDRAAFVPYIPSGDYRLVAVINGRQDYETYGVEKYENLCTKLKEESITGKLMDFFTSEKQISIGRSGPVIPTEKMMLAKHNNNIRLKILYDKYTAPYNMVLKAFVEENGGLFHYSTYSCSTTLYKHYFPWNTLLGNDGLPLQFDISVFRLWIGSNVSLCLREVDNITGTVTGRSYTLNIIEKLIAVRNLSGDYLYDTDEKLEYNDEYEITITLGKDFVVLSLIIDDWQIIGGGVEV